MKELLFSVTKKDLRIEYFCSGGPGGQHQNKTSSACRITHLASGAVGESREERKQAQNQRIAFRRLTESKRFKTWLKIAASEMMSGETVEQAVDRMMQPQNLRVDIKDGRGRWTREPVERV